MNSFVNYFKEISQGISSSVQGLGLTLRHLLNARNSITPKHVQSDFYFEQKTGIVTLQYPYESIPVPDNGRYRLHNEIDDCIVCDKCAKICPVNCIDIVAIKSTEEIGITSDGSSKRLYAATFDIDMAKCCYCGLCTTVCPTECLTMTPTFDYSEFDVREMNYHFSDLSPEEAIEKQKIYDQKQAEKAAAKLQPIAPTAETSTTTESPKPSFKPKFPVSKPIGASVPEAVEDKTMEEKPQPVFRPKMPTVKAMATSEEEKKAEEVQNADLMPNDDANETKPKVVFKPKMLSPKIPSALSGQTEEKDKPANESKDEQGTEKPKIVFKPKMPSPKIPPKTLDSE